MENQPTTSWQTPKPNAWTKRIFALRDAFFADYDYKPYPYQLEVSDAIIMELVLNLKVITGKDVEAVEQLKPAELPLEFARQSGKTTAIVWTLAFIMVWFPKIFGRPFHLGIFAPQYEQAKTDFDRLKLILDMVQKRNGDKGPLIVSDAPQNKKAKEESNARTLVLPMGSSCYVFPVSHASKPESKSLDLMVFEEAQDLIDVIVQQQIWPMGSTTNSPRVYIGTAGIVECYFKNMVDSGKALIYPWELIAQQRRQAFERDGDPRHLVYEQFVKGLAESLPGGFENDAIRRPYGLVWLTEKGMFITMAKLTPLRVEKPLEKADDLSKQFRDWWQTPAHLRLPNSIEAWAVSRQLTLEQAEELKHRWEYPHYFGLDTAKSVDQTVCKVGRVINDRITTVGSLALTGIDYEDQFPMLQDFLSVWNIEAGAIDSTGQGSFMPEKFKRYTPYNIHEVVFGLQSKHNLYQNWYNAILKPSFAYYWQPEGADPDDVRQSKEFEFETTQLIREVKQNKYWSVHHPEKDSAHDDHPDSTTLMLYAYQSYNGFSGIMDFMQQKAAPSNGVILPNGQVATTF